MNRFLLACLLLGLSLSWAFPVAAQNPDPRCITLMDDDCTAFTTALETMQGIGNFNNQAFSIMLGGSGGTSTGNSSSLTGFGPMQLSTTGAINAFDFTVTGSLDPSNPASEGQLIWSDDMLYLGTPAEDGTLTWTGTPTDTPQLELLMSVLSGNLLLTTLNAPGVAITQRGEDTEQAGQPMLVFESDIDLVTLLLTPEMLEVLESLLANLPSDMASSESAGGLEQLQGADLAGAIPLLSFLFTQDTFETVLWVGAEDGLVHHVELLIDWVIDPSMIDPTQSEATFNFELITDLDQHGTAPAITAPKEFELQEEFALDLGFSLEDLLGGAPEAQTEVENTLAYGESVTGTLSADNAQDIWGFDAEQGDIISITLQTTNPDSVLDTRLFLRDSEGVELASNDDHGTDNTKLLFSDALIQELVIPADGQYRIEATWLAPVRDGAYELTLEKAN